MFITANHNRQHHRSPLQTTHEFRRETVQYRHLALRIGTYSQDLIPGQSFTRVSISNIYLDLGVFHPVTFASSLAIGVTVLASLWEEGAGWLCPQNGGSRATWLLAFACVALPPAR